ncbi:MAG: glycoside hydrolase family 15 protein [Deltaproteobacteria bacterium]|nr:glycoside hydrolase family 15 protein [Deltaproteobacteria bacterium]
MKLKKFTAWGALFYFLAITFAHADDRSSTSLTDWQVELQKNSLNWMLSNISAFGTIPGSVMASDSTQNPDYRFHWKRDAALTMDVVVSLYENEKDPAKKEFYYNKIWDYARLSRKLQLTHARGGLGEPKFNSDGTSFDADWGRPQNDGPALEATVLIRFAKILMRERKSPVLIQELYDSKLPTNSVIKENLEYIGREWSADSFDLWEEVMASRHFYTQMAMRRALADGADLASIMGDRAASQWYKIKVAHLDEEINRHWDQTRKIILPTMEARSVKRASGIDIAIILGVLHSYRGDKFFAASDDRVLSTAYETEKAFKDLYPLNKGRENGIGIGRYPEDIYFGGHPWILASNAFSELYYLVIQDWKRKSKIDCTENNLNFLKSLLSVADAQNLKAGMVISSSDVLFTQIISALLKKADGYLKIAYEFQNPDKSLPEQIDKVSGQPVWKGNLTWSCASVLTALSARKI